MKSIAIALVVLLLTLLAWVAFQSSDISIIVNGHKLAGPEKLAAEGWSMLVALLSAAILLAFMFAGIGLIVLRVVVLAGNRAITADTDLRLRWFFGLSDGWWLRLQAHYDTEVAKATLAKTLAKIKPWKETATHAVDAH